MEFHLPSFCDGKKSLKLGVVYVVQDIFIASWGEVGLLLAGVDNRNSVGNYTGWTSSRFRKLTDIQADNAANREELIPCGKEARRE